MADEIPDEVRARLSDASKYHEPKGKKPPKEDPEEKIVIRVTEGKVIHRKKTIGTKIRSFFHHEDSQTVGAYVLMTVVLPAFRDLLFESINAGAEKAIYGDSISSKSYRRVGGSNKVPYDKISEAKRRGAPDPRSRTTISERGKKTHDFGEIVVPDRGVAEDAVGQLFELVEKYGMATVADLYGMLGIDSSFVDQKWGWTDLAGARVDRVRGGYYLRLPETEELD